MTDQEKDTIISTKIDGFSKLTDERLNNIKETLVRIEESSRFFALKSELEEAKKDFNNTVKQINEGFKQHNEDDKVSFKELADNDKKMMQMIWIAMGGVAVIGWILQNVVSSFIQNIIK